MGEKLVMVVNENGYRNLGEDDNFCMVGIVFDEESFCGSEDIKGELEKKLSIFENVYNNDEKYKSFSSRQKIVNNLMDSLLMFLDKLKFNIVLSSVRTISGDAEASYNKAAKKLITKFNMYISKRNMTTGGIISEETKESTEWKVKQQFFDIYNERNNNLTINESQINSFVVADRNSEVYKFDFDVFHLLDDIIKLMCQKNMRQESEIKELISAERLRAVSEVIKNKVINEEALDMADDIINDKNIIMKKMNEEIAKLKEELIDSNEIINNSKKLINELTNEIEILQEKLDKDSGKYGKIVLTALSE